VGEGSEKKNLGEEEKLTHTHPREELEGRNDLRYTFKNAYAGSSDGKEGS